MTDKELKILQTLINKLTVNGGSGTFRASWSEFKIEVYKEGSDQFFNLYAEDEKLIHSRDFMDNPTAEDISIIVEDYLSDTVKPVKDSKQSSDLTEVEKNLIFNKLYLASDKPSESTSLIIKGIPIKLTFKPDLEYGRALQFHLYDTLYVTYKLDSSYVPYNEVIKDLQIYLKV